MPRAEQGRGLRAVVFLDTVGSTQIASELGDERWQTLLKRELQILRRLLKERGGREVDVAGDGLFALFDEPAAAVRFAAEAADEVREIGLEVRAGVHFGEVEFADGRPAGIVVHTGARVMAAGGAGEVVVTQTVRDLLSGGRLSFAERGTHELKGVPGSWPLFALSGVDQESVTLPLDEDAARERRREASEPAPSVKRRTFLIGAGATAVAAASFGIYRLNRKEDDSSPAAPPGYNRLFRFDPATGDLQIMPARLPALGSILPSLAVGEGGVWVGDVSVHHVEPDSGQIAALVDIESGIARPVADIAVALDDIWAVSPYGLYRIDPADDEVLDVSPFDPAHEPWATGIAIGFRSVWTCREDGTLLRFDPGSGLSPLDEIPVGDVPSDLVIAAGALWVADEFGAVVRLDPGTGKRRRIDIGGAPKALAATEERLLAVDPEGVMTVVDFDTLEHHPVSLGGNPTSIAEGADAIWVGDLEGWLVQVDKLRLTELTRYRVPGHVANVAPDEESGYLWIRTVGKPPRD